MTLLEGIMGVIAIALLVGVLALTRLAIRIGRAADDVGLAARRVGELTPAAHELIAHARAELEALRSLTSISTRVVEDVRAVSGQASAVASQLSRGFDNDIVDRYRAILAGARAGFDVLRRFRSGNGHQSADVEEFEHMET